MTPIPSAKLSPPKGLAVIPNNRHERANIQSTSISTPSVIWWSVVSQNSQFRRVATRFEKTARNYRAVVTLAAIILWMR
jgi:transposase